MESANLNAGPQPPAARPRLADLVVAQRQLSLREAFPPASLIRIAVLAVLFVAVNYSQLDWLFTKWAYDANWTHGFIIPLFSLYLIYSRRDDFYAAPRKTNLLGLALLLVFLAGEFLGIYPIRNFWFSQLCMVGSLFALVLYLGGTKVMRVAWLPILFLVFAMPISDRIYTQVALPLQNFAAKGSVMILRLLGVQISSQASSLELISRSGQVHPLAVAEACSGMRLLMAFMALGVAMAYLDYKPIWQRLILVGAGVPIAVFCNVLRVSITSWMYYIDQPALGQDFMHYFTGVLMLIPALGLLWLLSWMLHKMVIEVDEEPADPGQERAQA